METWRFHSDGTFCGGGVWIPTHQRRPLTSPSDGKCAPRYPGLCTWMISSQTSPRARRRCSHAASLSLCQFSSWHISRFLCPDRRISYASLSRAIFSFSAKILSVLVALGCNSSLPSILPPLPSCPVDFLAWKSSCLCSLKVRPIFGIPQGSSHHSSSIACHLASV